MRNAPRSVISLMQVNVALTSQSVLHASFSASDICSWNFSSWSMVMPKFFSSIMAYREVFLILDGEFRIWSH